MSGMDDYAPESDPLPKASSFVSTLPVVGPLIAATLLAVAAIIVMIATIAASQRESEAEEREREAGRRDRDMALANAGQGPRIGSHDD
jgi:hypothetical protein